MYYYQLGNNNNNNNNNSGSHVVPPAKPKLLHGKKEKSTNLRNAKMKMDEEKTLERQRRVEALLKRPEERSREDVLLLEDCLLGVKFFEDSDRETRLELCRAVQYECFDPGYHVFREGEQGEKFYIILKGAVSVRHRDPMRQVDVTIATLQEGKSFGELALLKGESNVRTASVLCTDRAEFLVLHRHDYNKILNSMINKEIEEKVKFLRNVKTGAFRDLTVERLESLSGVLNLRKYPKNGILVRQGDDADELFFIKRGECRIVKEMEMCPRLLQELAVVSSRCPGALAEAMRSSSSYEREGGGKVPMLNAAHPLRTVLNDYFRHYTPYKLEHKQIGNGDNMVTLVENPSTSSIASNVSSSSSFSSSSKGSFRNNSNNQSSSSSSSSSSRWFDARRQQQRAVPFSHDKHVKAKYDRDNSVSENLSQLEKEMIEMQRKSGSGAGGVRDDNDDDDDDDENGMVIKRRSSSTSNKGRRKKKRFDSGSNNMERLLSPTKLPTLSMATRTSNATKPIRVFLEIGLLGANDIFGEMGVTIKSKRACSVIANCQVEVYVLNKWDLQRRLHDDVLLKILGKVSTYQSDEDIQREFISTLRWMEFKQSLINDVTSSTKRM